MRGVIILIAIVVIMVLAGWLTFYSSRGQVGVSVETEKIQKDTQILLEKGEQAADRASQKIDEAIHTPRESTPPENSGPSVSPKSVDSNR
ncbi:hypothetical protein [Planctomicrobium sp. SH664]|uniref:hypothetical protein n=1 Tax=Planctomicrobium sp. SH664 TaxID=3448125 RepID=UPI003F5C0519